MPYLAAGITVAAKQDHCQVVRTGHKFHIMRKTCSTERLLVVAALLGVVTGCLQPDQSLPFELADGEGATVTINASGGTVSLPPAFSLDIPAGSLNGSVSIVVTPRIDAPFPSDAGSPVPGSAFDVGPVGIVLAVPATVEIAVPAELLELGDAVRLLVAQLRQDGSVATFGGTYDVTNGILRADIDELGPIAAVVALDAIPLALEAPPTLGGGSLPQPPPAPPAPSGAQLSSHGGVEFSASCSPDARKCFTSGLVRVWADDVVRERLGEDLFLLSTRVEASLEFLDFDQNGVPTSLVGSITVDGDLRARLNSSITNVDVDDGVTSGPGLSAVPTPVQINSNFLLIGQTTTVDGDVELNDQVEFGITGIGTTEMLTIRVEAEVNFPNDTGPDTVGEVIAHIRMRR